PGHVLIRTNEYQAGPVGLAAAVVRVADHGHRRRVERLGVEGDEGEAGAERLEDVAVVRQRERGEVVPGAGGERVLAVRADDATGRSADDRRALVVRLEVAQPSAEAGRDVGEAALELGPVCRGVVRGEEV